MNQKEEPPWPVSISCPWMPIRAVGKIGTALMPQEERQKEAQRTKASCNKNGFLGAENVGSVDWVIYNRSSFLQLCLCIYLYGGFDPGLVFLLFTKSMHIDIMLKI